LATIKGEIAMSGKRTEQLQIMLAIEEINAIDDWRFAHHIPTRGAAVRELMRRGLNGKGPKEGSTEGAASREYGVLQSPDELQS
jgi:hypothetical protein